MTSKTLPVWLTGRRRRVETRYATQDSSEGPPVLCWMSAIRLPYLFNVRTKCYLHKNISISVTFRIILYHSQLGAVHYPYSL